LEKPDFYAVMDFFQSATLFSGTYENVADRLSTENRQLSTSYEQEWRMAVFLFFYKVWRK
jgi:hypothetical protein